MGSFNVSVACSIMLNNIFLMYPNMRGDMNENERSKLRMEWYNQLIHNESIQKQLNEYLSKDNVVNGSIKLTDSIIDARFNENDLKYGKSTKHKINHALRNR